MDTVVGSKQYRSIVVHDRPGRRLAIRLGVLILLLVASAAAYWIGGRETLGAYQQLKVDYQQAQQALTETQQELAKLSQRLTNQKMGSEVDRQAVEEIRAVVREHKETITKLNEEISFYKGLMAPTERERGLGIRSWEVYPTAEANRFQYRLVMQQLAVKHSVLSGAVSVMLVGRHQGVEQSYSLDILSNEVDKKDIRLRFKYFQYIDGELQLPEGFVVDRVDIVASATKPKKVKVEKHFGWVVQVAGL